VNGVDKRKKTPLHFAAGKGHPAVVLALLEKGAKPDRKDEVGFTPLHTACINGNAESPFKYLKN